jgi:hypothetical protein
MDPAHDQQGPGHAHAQKILLYFNWLYVYPGTEMACREVLFLPCGKICRLRLQKGRA